MRFEPRIGEFPMQQNAPVARVIAPVEIKAAMLSRPRALSLAIAVSATCLAGMGPLRAADVNVQYGITLAGLSIGKAQLSAALNGTGYTLNVSSALTGIVGAVSKGRGSATARGNVGASGVLTNGFSLSATNGKDTRTIQIAAASGSVRNVVIDPPFVDKGDGGDRIPLKDSHKIGVLDPVSALILPSKATDPLDKANCDRRIQVFDGSQRFDVVLSFAGVRQVKADKGYAGPVLVCSARYVPVAGHRPERRVTKFMAENRNIDAWFAPVNGGKLLIPYRISVKTMIGTSVIEAEAFNPG